VGIPTSFILTIIFFGLSFEYGGGSKFLGYVVIDAERLYVEFCIFVQCHIYVNCLPCYYEI
jgi:hypothetical protein